MAAANENGNGQSFEDLLDNEGTTAGALVLTAFMTTATQPLTCVRLLMQVIMDVNSVKLLAFSFSICWRAQPSMASSNKSL